MKKHFVTFYSPGSFVSETDQHEIDDWNVNTAMDMAKGITQRYGAKPYGFSFSTRERGPNDLDSKVTKTSGMYFLGGNVYTLDEVIARNNPDDDILISNMKFNNYKKVIVNTNSYKITLPFDDGQDIVLSWSV